MNSSFSKVRTKTRSLSSRESYPLLSALSDEYRPSSPKIFEGLTLVIAQHLLPSIQPFFEELFSFGALPSQTFIIGKIYSTNNIIANWLKELDCTVCVCQNQRPGSYSADLEQGAKKLWKRVESQSSFNRVLILDHGGFLRRNIPDSFLSSKQIVAVEHTSRGFFSDVRSPVVTIDMARSVVKTTQEPLIVAGQVIRRLKSLGALEKKTRVGILGVGILGKGIFESLVDLGFKVSIFDLNLQKLMIFKETASNCGVCETVEKLIETSDLIIGCTGRDSTELVNWSNFTGNKILASASSSDIEFSSLLSTAYLPKTSPGSNIIIKKGHCRLKVLMSGFPVNFDPNAPADNSIDITRALTLASCFHAAELLNSNMVLPISQKLQDFLNLAIDKSKIRFL